MYVLRVVKDCGMCLIFEFNDLGINCNYWFVVKDLVVNVFLFIVDGRFYCKEGDWWMMKMECLEEDNKVSLRIKGIGWGWLFGLMIFFVLISLL